VQRIADHLFSDLRWVYVCIDDILIASETFYEHVQVLQEVFSRIREACLRVSVKKSSSAKMLLTKWVDTSVMKGFNLRILTSMISFSFQFLKMLRSWEVLSLCAIIAETSFPIFLQLHNLYRSCSGKVLVRIWGRMRWNVSTAFMSKVPFLGIPQFLKAFCSLHRCFTPWNWRSFNARTRWPL